MRPTVLNRKTHYWGAALIALPVVMIACSGILLHLKKHWTWVQPAEHRGTGTAPEIDFAAILSSVRSVTELGVTGWDDIKRVDVRPGRGMAKVWIQNGWEVQVDLGTGRVLQSAYRRSDLIESLHDGSFFAGDVSRLGVFLPAGVVLLLMWTTGLWMFWHPFLVRRRRRKAHQLTKEQGPMPKLLIAFAVAMLTAGSTAASDKSDVMVPVHQFIDAFNKGDVKTATAACADQTSIIDEFPPYEWHGTGACLTWINDYDADAKKNQITDGIVTLSTPRHVDIAGDRAYVVAPANYTYKKKGKVVKEIDSTITLVLQLGQAGWRITGWAWAKR